ncbi:hypothetical protein SDC9_175769 [bioreactor metagenome]|uniref:Uncharacterized protein n=1 Tax=bioreactor metagenome TaxID=1076179 RepID=A0A645GN39_9ZZZZ
MEDDDRRRRRQRRVEPARRAQPEPLAAQLGKPGEGARVEALLVRDDLLRRPVGGLRQAFVNPLLVAVAARHDAVGVGLETLPDLGMGTDREAHHRTVPHRVARPVAQDDEIARLLGEEIDVADDHQVEVEIEHGPGEAVEFRRE